MKLHRTLRHDPWWFMTAAVVDVAFLLLFFFIFSPAFLLQPGVRVDLPVSTFALGPIERPEVVSITAPPANAIYFRNRRVTADELVAGLREEGARGRTVVLKADRAVPYEEVLAVAGRCLQGGVPVVLATGGRPVPSPAP